MYHVTWPPQTRLYRDRDSEALDDGPAARLLAAVVERARADAEAGDARAAAWLDGLRELGEAHLERRRGERAA